MNNKFKFLLPVVFILITSYTLLAIFHSAIAFNWTFQDWLINYEGGFVRRGLSGQLIGAINNYLFEQNKQFYFNIQIHIVYFYIISFCSILFYSLIYRLIKFENLNFQNLFIIFSPISIPFVIYNSGAIARKEILLFIIFLFFIYLI